MPNVYERNPNLEDIRKRRPARIYTRYLRRSCADVFIQKAL